MKSNKVRLTENAKKQLAFFKEELTEQLMDIITKDKSYPGIEEVEVTASDIMRYGKRIVIYNEKKKATLSFLALAYMLVSLIFVIGGLFYDFFIDLGRESPERLMFILSGFTLFLMALIILFRNFQYSKKSSDFTAYNNAMEFNQQNAKFFFVRANAKLSMEDFLGAIADYNRAIELNPQDDIFYYNRAITKGRINDYLGALADYDRAIELNPQDANYYSNRAIIKKNMGEYLSAFSDYNMAIKLNPQDARFYYNRATAKSFVGDYKGALEDFDRAIELEPDCATAYNNRAFSIWLKKGELDKALVDVNIAIKIDNTIATFYDTRGEVYSAMERYEEALKDFSHAISLDNKDKEFYEHRANCYRKMAKYEKDISKQEDLIAKAVGDEEKVKGILLSEGIQH